MSKNDERVMQLKKIIEEKKLEAEEIIEVLQKSTTLKQHEITALKTQLKTIGEVETKKVETPGNKHVLTAGDFVHIIPLGKIGEIVQKYRYRALKGSTVGEMLKKK